MTRNKHDNFSSYQQILVVAHSEINGCELLYFQYIEQNNKKPA
ncbi:hypothetical protein AALB_1001 [Agarivorans albus MKT 106]|uniref:Uncharacterized protein n=1 Tax=Agarivorans albus MKT 106 TaxID=1331007 RepID=R9PS47_AGAAL|nr:hypothetical protein AALB_1001 [Agarivorans albus MKT 106]